MLGASEKAKNEVSPASAAKMLDRLAGAEGSADQDADVSCRDAEYSRTGSWCPGAGCPAAHLTEAKSNT
jgi:hypothetical protein